MFPEKGMDEVLRKDDDLQRLNLEVEPRSEVVSMKIIRILHPKAPRIVNLGNGGPFRRHVLPEFPWCLLQPSERAK
jgi:hypothetical protein